MSNAVFALHAHLPEFSFEMFDVGLVHRCEPLLLDEFDDAQNSLTNIRRQRIELALNSSA